MSPNTLLSLKCLEKISFLLWQFHSHSYKIIWVTLDCWSRQASLGGDNFSRAWDKLKTMLRKLLPLLSRLSALFIAKKRFFASFTICLYLLESSVSLTTRYLKFSFGLIDWAIFFMRLELLTSLFCVISELSSACSFWYFVSSFSTFNSCAQDWQSGL